MRGDLAKREPLMLAQWQAQQRYQRIRKAAAGRPKVHPARRSALCERRHPPGPRGEQDPQGHHRQVQDAGRLRCALRAGLGLPRPAHRTARGEEARQEHPACAVPRAVPRVCGGAGRAPEEGLHPPGRAGRLGPSLPHHGFQDRGGHHPRARQDLRARLPVPGAQAGELVPGLRFGAGRSGSGIRGQGIGCHRRRLRGEGPARGGEGVRRVAVGQCEGVCGDLDDHAVDAASQPGGERASGIGIRPDQDREGLSDPGIRLGNRLPETLPVGRQQRPG